MAIYERGLVVGRFQPFHKGHLYLLRTIQKKIKKIVVGVGSANVFDEDNPFTYEERKEMIEMVIHKERLNDVIEKIVPLNDYYNDEIWFKHTISKAGIINILIGNNEWPNHIFERRGYTIWRIGFFKKYLYEGERIRRLIRQKKEWQDRVPSYLVSCIKRHLRKRTHIPYRFQHIAIGGTFDHFHKGHKKLIDTAFRFGYTVSIGISVASMTAQKESIDSIENYNVRKKSVIDYLKKKKLFHRAIFFPLSDIYGPTKTDGTIEAIVVSKMVYHNALKINKLRSEKKLPELKIIPISDVKSKDEKLISSARIRNGEIDRNGEIYGIKKQLFLPEYLREELRKPLGNVIHGKETGLKKTAHTIQGFIRSIKLVMVIAVGDIIANSLEENGFTPDVKIIDFRSRRQDIKKGPLPQKRTVNRPGTISIAAVRSIKNAIGKSLKTTKQQTVVINGEEDLLALPAILLAPLQTIVLYGQIDLGVVGVIVTEETKKKIQSLIHRFG